MPARIPVWRPHQREVKHACERGYDARWQKLRKQFLRDWLENKGPHCALCGGLLRPGRETHVDHVKPFDGVGDPLRLAWDNLRVLCARCNSSRPGG